MATFGVALLYWFVLPRFAVASGVDQPALTLLAEQAGKIWAVLAIAIGIAASWLVRTGARDRAQLLGRFLLHFLLLLDVLMVALMIAGIYAAIVALPGRVSG